MSEMHLRQCPALDKSRFAYSACGLFTKNKKRIKKFKETRDLRYIYQNEPDKACCQHDMVYWGFKDLTRKTASGKTLCDTNAGLLQWYINLLTRKASATSAWPETLAVSGIKNEDISNKELAEELHLPIIRKFFKKVHLPFIDNSWSAELTDYN